MIFAFIDCDFTFHCHEDDIFMNNMSSTPGRGTVRMLSRMVAQFHSYSEIVTKYPKGGKKNLKGKRVYWLTIVDGNSIVPGKSRSETEAASHVHSLSQTEMNAFGLTCAHSTLSTLTQFKTQTQGRMMLP